MPPTARIVPTGSVHPADWTGRQLQRQRLAATEKAKSQRDVEIQVSNAREEGWREGYREAEAYFREHYDLIPKRLRLSEEEAGIFGEGR